METVKHSFLSMPIFWQARANTAMLSFAKKDPFSSCDITIGWSTGIFVEGFHLDVGKTLLHDCAENLVLTFPSVSNGSVFQCEKSFFPAHRFPIILVCHAVLPSGIDRACFKSVKYTSYSCKNQKKNVRKMKNFPFPDPDFRRSDLKNRKRGAMPRFLCRSGCVIRASSNGIWQCPLW